MMNEEDRQTYLKGRPYIIGLVALAFRLTAREKVSSNDSYDHQAFSQAKRFITEFEIENGIDSKGNK